MPVDREIINLVEEPPEGGYTARALGHAIFTEADTWEELRSVVQDAVRCHFEEAERPSVVHPHLVCPSGMRRRKTMSLVSVQAVYDGKKVTFLEPPPVSGPYRVVVTFIEPEEGTGVEMRPRNPARFWASFGAWQDDRPVEATLRDIHEARRSRTEPPTL